MSFREWIVKIIAPEIYTNARKYEYSRDKITEANEWLSEDFPVVLDVLSWISRCTETRFMSLRMYDVMLVLDPKCVKVDRIEVLKEKLRKKYIAMKL